MPESHSLHAQRMALARATRDALRHPTDPTAVLALTEAREAYAVEKTLDTLVVRLAGATLSSTSRRRLVKAVLNHGAAA